MVNLQRTLLKGLRDFLVVGVSAGLLALANNQIDLGLPPAIAPLVSVLALAVYRLVRDNFGTSTEE